MKSASEWHDLAMKALYSARDYEVRAARMLEPFPENEPSRGMLYLGAASMCINLEQYDLANMLINEALGGHPTERIRGELEELRGKLQFYGGTEQAEN